MNRILKYLKGRKGITLVWMAFMLAILLMLAGMAIDIAYMYYVKNQLQVAADASALAGAANLGTATDSNTSAYGQLSARQAAWKFACKNRAANQSVFLVTNSSTNCDAPPASGLNETSNTSTGDIVVGNWNSSTRIFTPATGSTGLPINALQARPRRTNETPGMPRVSLFIGQIFRIIGADWSAMSARASAIAARAPLAAPGIPLCLPSCNFTVFPKTLILQKDTQGIPIDDGMAWTAFTGDQAPNIGKGGDVVDYIWSRKQPPPLCDLCITTNNGVGVALKELKDAFESTTHYKQDKDFDSNGNVIKWKVAVPILDRSCDNPCPDPKLCPDPNDPNNLLCNPANCACPPGGQGSNNEKYHIAQLAELHITSVITTSNKKGITVDYIHCIGCPTDIPLGRNFALVK